MAQNLIPTYDRKKALTKTEFSEVVEKLSGKTEVEYVYSVTRVIDGKKQYFYVVRIKEFKEYPSFIGSVHEKYGRGIEISTYFPKVQNTKEMHCIDIYVRGYAKELDK